MHTYTWKLNNTLLNDNLVKEEIKKKMKDSLEFNKNEDTSYQNLWDTMKAVLWGKLIARLTSGHRDSIQINKIRKEKRDKTMENVETQKIIRSYYKSLYSTKLENQDEMGNFLDTYQVPKLK